MNKTYELVVVFDSSLEIEQIESDLRKIQDLINEHRGTIRVWERWGKRRLAYEIRGRQYGYYTILTFDLSPDKAGEIERLIRLTPNFIRHLMTIVEPSRVPEIDEESVRTLGAARNAAPEVIEGLAAAPAAEEIELESEEIISEDSVKD